MGLKSAFKKVSAAVKDAVSDTGDASGVALEKVIGETYGSVDNVAKTVGAGKLYNETVGSTWDKYLNVLYGFSDILKGDSITDNAKDSLSLYSMYASGDFEGGDVASIFDGSFNPAGLLDEVAKKMGGVDKLFDDLVNGLSKKGTSEGLYQGSGAQQVPDVIRYETAKKNKVPLIVGGVVIMTGFLIYFFKRKR